MKAYTQRPWTLIAGGALLLVLALVLLVTGERSLLGYRAASALHGGEVMDLGRDARPRAGQYGSMLRVVGVPQVVQAPRDPLFNVSASGTRLQRVVEMFQWHELRMGGQVYYEQDWIDHPVDSERFVQPRGHRNGIRFPFRSEVFVAPRVRLDGFLLDSSMLAGINGDQPVTPQPQSLPPNLAASFQLHDDALVTSARPGSPQLGDIRVSWQAVPPQLITVIARADGDKLVPARDAGDGVGFQVELGDRSLRDMLPDLPERPGGMWWRRGLAWLLAWAGVVLLAQARRQGAVAWVSTLAVAVALCAGVGAVLWLTTDLTAGLVLAGTALVSLALVFWLVRGRAA